MRPLAVAALLSSVPALGASQPWPQWRGPDGQGHAPTRVPVVWSDTTNVTWTTPLPGRGWSSPVIWDDRIWLTTAHETPASPEETERRLKARTSNDPLTVLAEVRLHVLGLDRRTGRLLHDVELFREPDPQWVHKVNSYASPTPVLEAGRVYGHFGTFGTACLDAGSGRILWTNTSLRIMHENGPGSSPVLWRDLLIVHFDGSDQQFVAALDKHSGRLVWKTPRSGALRDYLHYRKSYGTPQLVELDGQPQLISPGADWLYAYAPATGRELWRMSYGVQGFSIAPRPVVGPDLLYVCTCFPRSELVAVRYREAGDQAPPPIAWRYHRGVPQVPNPILVGDALYFVSDSGGLVTCLEARTGAERWRERIGGNHAAAPLYAGGRLYFCGQDGVTTVIEPGTAFKVLHKNALPGRIFASPAAVDGALFIRTDQALYRIESIPAVAQLGAD